ncbi:unnamed protein product [Psylliodes chrysocephalus]|uniref:G-protein coupled receptors family 2 profile 2 domain-containing protein n=2 Tax=Psylliodes chrysocephalus TaxID=3402493 RepID=A0A9P0CMK6_9CUCU|nr:unnamed protein product [Psylliodes chrysocephala]
MILDGDIIPPNEYCLTTIESRNIEVYILCNENDSFEEMSRLINTILCLISVFFIILTVFVYFLIPEPFELQEIILIHSISGLALGYISMAIINLAGYLPAGFCHGLAYLMYVSFLYSFFWLNILCFHIWKNVMHFESLERIKYWKIIYHIYGICSPFLALCWVILLNHAQPEGLDNIHPGIGGSICWFQSLRETAIFFYGPITVLLILNIVFFVWTAAELWQRSKNCPKTKVLKYRLRLYMKLFFIMGITWILEIVSAAFHDSKIRWIWIITDIFNALQGFVIFLILVVFRKKIKRSLASRKFYKLQFPVYWKNDKDSECEELEEEFSLSYAHPAKINI